MHLTDSLNTVPLSVLVVASASVWQWAAVPLASDRTLLFGRLIITPWSLWSSCGLVPHSTSTSTPTLLFSSVIPLASLASIFKWLKSTLLSSVSSTHQGWHSSAINIGLWPSSSSCRVVRGLAYAVQHCCMQMSIGPVVQSSASSQQLPSLSIECSQSTLNPHSQCFQAQAS